MKVFHSRWLILKFTSIFVFTFSFSHPTFATTMKVGSNSVQKSRKLASFNTVYQPYIEIGGIQYFNQEPEAAGIYDFFFPLFTPASDCSKQLIFTDLRFFDRTGSSFEGNAHVGYRVLLPETKDTKNQLFGVYLSFDRRKSEKKNYFNQITIGGEIWLDKWFIGGNIYTPIGKKKRLTSDALPSETQPISWKEERSLGKIIEYTGTITTTKTKHVFEKSLYGMDVEVGHVFSDQITGYVGGYWFHDGFFNSAQERETQTKWGPRVRFTYNCHPVHAKRAFGILDGISLEAGIQHDKPRGTSGYIGFKLKAGLTHSQKTTHNLSGFERHMTELVRRDPDIVLNETKTTETTTILKKGIELSNHQGYVSFPKEEPIESPETLEYLLFQFGLSPDATEQEIRKQYRNYAKKYHPDKNKDTGATEKFIYYTYLYDLIQEKRKTPTEKNTNYGFSPPSASQKNNRHSDSSSALVFFDPPIDSPISVRSSSPLSISKIAKETLKPFAFVSSKVLGVPKEPVFNVDGPLFNITSWANAYKPLIFTSILFVAPYIISHGNLPPGYIDVLFKSNVFPFMMTYFIVNPNVDSLTDPVYNCWVNKTNGSLEGALLKNIKGGWIDLFECFKKDENLIESLVFIIEIETIARINGRTLIGDPLKRILKSDSRADKRALYRKTQEMKKQEYTAWLEEKSTSVFNERMTIAIIHMSTFFFKGHLGNIDYRALDFLCTMFSINRFNDEFRLNPGMDSIHQGDGKDWYLAVQGIGDNLLFSLLSPDVWMVCLNPLTTVPVCFGYVGIKTLFLPVFRSVLNSQFLPLLKASVEKNVSNKFYEIFIAPELPILVKIERTVLIPIFILMLTFQYQQRVVIFNL